MKRSILALIFAGLALGSLASAQAAVETYDIDPVHTWVGFTVSHFFTKDVARGKRVASRIDTGMVFINHPTWTTADLPFGGIKNSGYGRELSSLGIQEFVNKKLVRVASINAPA